MLSSPATIVALANRIEPPVCVSAPTKLLIDSGLPAGVCTDPGACTSWLAELLAISCMSLDPDIVVVLANGIGPPTCVSAMTELLIDSGMFTGVVKTQGLCVSLIVKPLVVSCGFPDPAVIVGGLAKTIEPPMGVDTPGNIEKPYPGGTPVTNPVVVLDTMASIDGVTMYPPP